MLQQEEKMAWKGLTFKPEAKKKFLEALRSGKYPQGRRFLGLLAPDNTWEGLCCLGVLAVINGITSMRASTERITVITSMRPSRRIADFDFGALGHKQGVPPPEWMAQFIDSEGTAPISLANISSLMEILMTKNDRLVPFAEIADWIEANL